MIPQELILRNFMCYRDSAEPLRLDGIHIACLTGENGAGKSALLDAITWVLWGQARMGDDELIAQGESAMSVELIFRLTNQDYRVIRSRQHGKSGTKSGGRSALDLQVRNDQGWKSLSETTIKGTEATIAGLLRMKYDTFINSSFLLQGRADEFTRKTAGDRKQVLADILDLHEYELLEERAKLRAKKLEETLKVLEGRMEQLRQQADQISLYTRFVADATLRVEALQGQLTQAETDRQAAEAHVQTLEQTAVQRRELGKQLASLRRDQQQLDLELVERRAAITQAEALVARSAAIAAGMATLVAARAELNRLDALRPRYDELREQWKQLNDEIKDEERRLKSDLDRSIHQRDALEKQLAERPQQRQAHATTVQQLADLEPRVEQLRLQREQLDQLQTQIRQANELLLRRSELVNQIQRQQQVLTTQRDEQRRAVTRLERAANELAHIEAALLTAQTAGQSALALGQQLEGQRTTEREAGEQLAALRATCTQLKQQADQMKKGREFLEASQSTTCPVCQHELGDAGLVHALAHYDQEITTLRAHYQTANQQAKRIEQALGTQRAEIAGLEANHARLLHDGAQVQALQQQRDRANEAVSELAQTRTRLAALERELADERFEREARATLLATDTQLATLNVTSKTGVAGLEQAQKTVQGAIKGLETSLAARPALEERRTTIERRITELDQLAAELPPANAAVAALQKIIEENDFAHPQRSAQTQVRSQGDALGYNQKGHEATRHEAQQLAPWEKEERELHAAQIRLEGDRRVLQQSLELHARRTTEIDQLTREDALLEQELRQLPPAKVRAETAVRTVADCRLALGVTEKDRTEKETHLRNAHDAAQQLAEAEQQRTQLTTRREVFRELTEAFGKRGVQAMLIETAVPQIADEANRLLARMTDNQMHVTIEMQRETKKGDAVETLEIKIADMLGTRTYDAFSGGEAMRVNFAIRIALSRLLARRAGANLETLVIDEGFGTLDALGRERFVEAITSVQHDFKRILVITHIEELKERFPALIEITKTPLGSRWELR